MRSDAVETLENIRTVNADVVRIRGEIIVTAQLKPKESGNQTESAQNRGKLWPTGATLKVGFFDGDTKIRREIVKVAGEWSQHANIRFTAEDNPLEADVRVSLSGVGAWSYIGTDARKIPKSNPTVTLEGGRRQRLPALDLVPHGLVADQHPARRVPGARLEGRRVRYHLRHRPFARVRPCFGVRARTSESKSKNCMEYPCHGSNARLFKVGD